MIKIIPTVFAKDKKEFQKRLEILSKISGNIQIDIMDGKFVSAKSISVDQIPKLKGKGNFEAHLMTLNPSKHFKKLKSLGFRKIIFHCDTEDNLKAIVEAKKLKLRCFMAINPELPVAEICYLLPLVDGVLVMGVKPGKEGQKLISSIPGKIKEIRRIDKNIDIQVDGGVNDKTINKLSKAGANIFNVGSYVSASENPKRALLRLKRR